jgi:hypothetical protein
MSPVEWSLASAQYTIDPLLAGRTESILCLQAPFPECRGQTLEEHVFNLNVRPHNGSSQTMTDWNHKCITSRRCNRLVVESAFVAFHECGCNHSQISCPSSILRHCLDYRNSSGWQVRINYILVLPRFTEFFLFWFVYTCQCFSEWI